MSGCRLARRRSSAVGSGGVGGGGNGSTIPARATCGMREGSEASAWACNLSDAAFRLVDAQNSNPPHSAAAPARATQTGTPPRPGR